MNEFHIGHQILLDSGIKNMPLHNRNGSKKVCFLATVMAHLRYKYGYFRI